MKGTLPGRRSERQGSLTRAMLSGIDTVDSGQPTAASCLEVKLPPEDTPPPEDVIEADTQIDPFTLSDDDFTIWFLEENLVADPEHFLPNQEVYRRYQQVCSTYYRQPLEDRRLYQSLRKLYSVSSRRRRIDSIPTRGFLGVRSVDPNDQ